MQTSEAGWPLGDGRTLAPNMAYAPRSRPTFPGDLQHDFRDYQLDGRLETLSIWVGRAAGLYHRAAVITGVERTDPIADSLAADDRFDARTLWVAHDHMAAVWRLRKMPAILTAGVAFVETPGDEAVLSFSPAGLMVAFRNWLEAEIVAWAETQPALLRLFLRTLLGEHGPTGQMLEAELFYALAHRHPLPGLRVPPPQPGLIAGPRA